jgi:hypothetical protein
MLRYTTDDDRFRLVEIEIKLPQKLSYRLRRSNRLIAFRAQPARSSLAFKKKNKQKEETFSFPPGIPQSSPLSVPNMHCEVYVKPCQM